MQLSPTGKVEKNLLEKEEPGLSLELDAANPLSSKQRDPRFYDISMTFVWQQYCQGSLFHKWILLGVSRKLI